MEHNGHAAVDRLVTINRSLNRALASVEREMAHRDQLEDYKETYLYELLQLVERAGALEDDLRKKLVFG